MLHTAVATSSAVGGCDVGGWDPVPMGTEEREEARREGGSTAGSRMGRRVPGVR